MSDLRVERLAELLVDYSVAVRPGDRVAVQGGAVAAPLLLAIYRRVLQAGGMPYLMPTIPGSDEVFFRHASDEQLKHVPPPFKMMMETYDVRIAIGAETNTKSLSGVDPAKVVTVQQARTEIMKTFLQRAAKGELRWTYSIYPTSAYAQDAEMSLTDYEDFLYHACLGDIDDPIGHWKRVSERQQKIVEWLKGKKKIHVVAPGTDLSLSIEGRTFINCNGKENVPDGEVFTGPVEDSVEGHVCFSYPTIENGREITDIRLWFEGGKVVKATAAKNEDFLLKTLDTDDGARRVGEFAFGTNRGITRFTRQILFDEKIGGSFHMALGAAYPETGAKNESAIHWDMICDMRQGGLVTADGEALYKDGDFVIPL
jgi:aminopeptidase